MINKEFLRYLDLFGTKCSFYTDQKLKLYTPLGGILSLTSFIVGIFIFIYINIKSFKRQDPIIISSSLIEENHIIKFKDEHIWIPWKISSYADDNFFNHTGILYPIINYYSKENNSEIVSRVLSYRLCNETSMIDNLENILIDTSLNELYCIDMDNLFMGGSLSSNLYYYIEFNLYICQGGVNYDKNNTNCISYDNLNNIYNYLQIILYYPTIQFDQINFETPIKIKYNKNCVLLSQNISKYDQLFLNKIVLYDQLGLFDTTTKFYQYWGYSSINKDFYIINNQNKTKLYSFNIFIESKTIYYYRSYKSIFLILAQSLPLITLVHNILKLIAKVFKLSSVNRKMIELLFENLSEKKNNYNNYIKEFNSKRISRNNMNNRTNDDNTIINLTNKDNLNNLNNFTSYSLFRKNQKENKNFKITYRKKGGSPIIEHKAFALNEKKNMNFRINSFNFNNLTIYKNLSLRYQDPVFPRKKRFVANQLFPFRYYFCSILVKNLDLTKHRFCMSRKFIKVYIFLCQLFDISSYCALQKEFNIVKNSIFDEKNIQLIENKNKVNVNSQTFMSEMNYCIGKHKFNIHSNNFNLKRRSIPSQFSNSDNK